MVLRRDNPYARVSVPDHKQIRIGTLRQSLQSHPSKCDLLPQIAT